MNPDQKEGEINKDRDREIESSFKFVEKIEVSKTLKFFINVVKFYFYMDPNHSVL